LASDADTENYTKRLYEYAKKINYEAE